MKKILTGILIVLFSIAATWATSNLMFLIYGVILGIYWIVYGAEYAAKLEAEEE